jgi:hypothetical protein
VTHPMYLPDVEHGQSQGSYAAKIEGMRAAGVMIPQIMHLFAFKPDRTDFLAKFTQAFASSLPPSRRDAMIVPSESVRTPRSRRSC